MKTVARGLIPAALLILLNACGHQLEVAPHQLPEEPIKLKDAVWQQAWVDPTVLYSDSLFTLIRADRIDSFLVPPAKLQPELPDLTSPAGQNLPDVGAVKFRVPEGGCRVSITLVGDKIVLQPVSGKTVTGGYYKLTCDLSKISPAEMPTGQYKIAIDYCGQTRSGRLQK